MDEQPESKPLNQGRSPPDFAGSAHPPINTDDADAPTIAGSMDLHATPFPRLPVRFGRYQLEKLLGKGAMGAVYLAHDTELERPVALKVPHVAGGASGDLIPRLVRESKAAAALSHPNICRVYDAGVQEGMFFIAMEFVDGRKLSEYISPTQPLDERQCVSVIRKLAGALAEAHAKGIIHRDVKPDNILINSRGEPVLTDFGLARISKGGLDGRMTQSGMLVGSPAYMSPEQTTGDPTTIGPRSDIYALGIVLFEMLTGRLPFEGSIVSVLAQIATKDVPAPSALRPGLDPRLDAISRRMTARSLDDRYLSMTEIVRDLGDWLKAPSPQASLKEPAPSDAAPATKQSRVSKKPETSAESVAQSERLARKHLLEQNYASAIPMLSRLAELPAAQFGETAEWATNELPLAKKKQHVLSERNQSACKQAREHLKAFEYHQAVQLIEALPAAGRSDDARQLLSEATEKHEDCMSLKDEIDEAVRRKRYDRLPPLVERYLALNPNNARIQRLADNLARNQAERAARQYAGAGKYFDVAGKLVEPKEALLGLGVVGLLLFGVNWMIQSYVADVQERAGSRQSSTEGTNSLKDRAAGRNNPKGPPPKILVAPFSADEAREAQESWARYLGVPVEYSNSVGMKFRLIPPGEFIMGSTDQQIEAALPVAGGNVTIEACMRGEAPKHKVTLTKPFYFGAHEVTQEQYQEIMGNNPSSFSPAGKGSEQVKGLNTAWHPVDTVSWEDAAEFCRRLNVNEKCDPMYARVAESMTILEGNGYQLPTEAQWEYAARAGTTSVYCSGDSTDDLSQVGWTMLNSGKRTHAVRELQANRFGIHDVHGNVYEWVQDAWAPDSYGQRFPAGAIDPVTSSSTTHQRVLRGGGWSNHFAYCRSSYRYANKPDYRVSGIGFRISLSVDAVKATETRTADNVSKVANLPEPRRLSVPFSAQEARAAQVSWAQYLGVPAEYVNSIGMKFRLIPPGEFAMGSTDKVINDTLPFSGSPELQARVRSEAPRHKVVLTRPFYLGEFEVTQAEYQQVVGPNPSAFSPTGRASDQVKGIDTSRHPVEMVSWDDAAEFCRRLNVKEKREPMYARVADATTILDGEGYRLPTEAQWEFGAAAGTTTYFWSGENDEALASVGWHRGNSGGRTHAVGELQANPFGLFDVHGNVSEWVQDAWSADSYKAFQNAEAVDPFLSSTSDLQRAHRGGNFSNNYRFLRTSGRNAGASILRISGRGFRIALSVEAVKVGGN